MNILDDIAESNPDWKSYYVDNQLILVKVVSHMLAQQSVSQSELAKAADLEEVFVRQLLAGERDITLDVLARFQAVFGQDILSPLV